MNESVDIVLPLPVKVLSPNCTIGSIGDRFLKASATKKYRRLAREAVQNECIKTGPWTRVKVNATFYHKTERRRDPDNATGSLKAAYDGIVDAGLAVDDDCVHMRRGEPEFLIDKKHPRVELTILNISELEKK